MKTLYYHTAVWCSPCKQLAPLIDRLAKKFGITVVKIDIDTTEPIITDITSVPTLVLSVGGEITGRLDGPMATAANVRKLLAGE